MQKRRTVTTRKTVKTVKNIITAQSERKRISQVFASLLFSGAFFFYAGAYPCVYPCAYSRAYPCALQSWEQASAQSGVQVSEQAEWQTISSYTTYYNVKEAGRSENIRIAASLISGVTLQAYGEFSFNQTVGKRTEEAGFQQAKIIVGGEYVLGTGGGVCQVSTTLYNAALKSGLTVTEYHPHTLAPAYVEPSRDAMVSTQSDLKLFNPYPYSVRLITQVSEGSVRVRFLRKQNANQNANQTKSQATKQPTYRYEISSCTLEEIAPPPPIIKEGEEEKILRSPKNGVKSEAYLACYRGETLLWKKLLRKDEYRPVQGIIAKKIPFTSD